MYNYYLDYLISFKRFIASNFPEIKHYQFNYADKAFLNYKLYQEHVKEYPMCIITLTDITTDDNKDFFRYIGMKYSKETVQLLASNHTKQDSVIMDFKWVTIQTQVRINLTSLADLLSYHNQLISAFPKSFMFYSYKYNAYIPIDEYTKTWESTDDTEGLYYRTEEQKIQAFARYSIEPIFRVNSVVKNKIIGDDTSLDINLEVRLKVPNYVGTKTVDNRLLNGIQVVINDQALAGDLPILIDMDNDIFSDRRLKLQRGYIINKTHFSITENQAKFKIDDYDLIDKNVGVYMVDDSTLNDPKVFWTEKFINIDNIIDGYYVIDLVDDLVDFQFSELSNLQLLIFN